MKLTNKGNEREEEMIRNDGIENYEHINILER